MPFQNKIKSMNLLAKLLKKTEEGVAIVYEESGPLLGCVVALRSEQEETTSEQNVHYQQDFKLSKRGYRVEEIPYPDNWDTALKWAKSKTMEKFLKDLSKKYNGNVLIVGRSCSCLLTKVMFEYHSEYVKRVLYLCPIWRPLESDNFSAKTLRSIEKMWSKNQFDNRFIFQKNLLRERTIDYNKKAMQKYFSPLELFDMEKNSLDERSELCDCSSKAFINDICLMFEN